MARAVIPKIAKTNPALAIMRPDLECRVLVSIFQVSHNLQAIEGNAANGKR